MRRLKPTSETSVNEMGECLQDGGSHLHIYKVAIYTNNGVERQNETLKHKFLEGYKNSSLSELLTLVVSDFLPKAYQK
ncbi:hypothetical protein JOQ06_029219 [Pogonophryne albipinna]|uniref:Uncharacterized protein n=1 Tax=Pogonophryne albipinna TaxID=1090488 RepID=A0AAD6BAF7_9TELE|nr:hypothetical protein JOQ06_029219 [Pogonophryne albipinna]